MKQIRWLLIAIFVLLVAAWLGACGVAAQTRASSNQELVQRVSALETEVAGLKAGPPTPGRLAMVAPTLTPPTPTQTATPPATPTATLTPTATPESGPFFEIAGISSRITESNNIWWKFAWLLTLRNISSSRLLFNADIKFLDADGFPVDQAQLNHITLEPLQTQDFSDFLLIDVAVAPKVARVIANVEIVERTPLPGATPPITATPTTIAVSPTVTSTVTNEVVTLTVATATVTPIAAQTVAITPTATEVATSAPTATEVVANALTETITETETLSPSANDVLALLVPTPTPAANDSTPAHSQTPAGRYNRYWAGNAKPSLPTPSDKDFDVILLQRDEHNLWLLLRNNTTAPVTGLNLDAVARAADGSMLGIAQNNSASPRLVAPGEVSFATLPFGDLLLPPDAHFDFEVHADAAAANTSYGDLTINEENLVQGRYVGMAKNNSAQTVALMQASLLWFDKNSAFLSAHSNLTPKNDAAPGAVVPFQVELKGHPCPTYWLGVAGVSH